MKQQVIKELSTSELVDKLEEWENQALKMQLNHAISPLDNPGKIKVYRRAIARMKTELKCRENN
ncbi:MAG: 50S ribosomal protein L29 [Bacteroidales bacterium]|jgi:large subunit ribosomal protein L29|nr:50S ribosomal protein L29 [Bacteroidales bacterium]MDD3152401.1 50S ribosomal protein L29 [Bacteroidales bacterium]MDD3913926.1 50S ribosomal protein L29 [Bacteroidales bacterium]MDD4634235.1 50S ribosomal protein L29 [Bacteroidales bacterium]